MVRMLRATKASKNSPEMTVDPTPSVASGGIISGGAVSAGKTSGEVAGSRRGLRVQSGRRRPCLGNWKWTKLGLVVERDGEDGRGGGGELGVKGKTRGRAAMTAVGWITMAMAFEFGFHGSYSKLLFCSQIRLGSKSKSTVKFIFKTNPNQI